MTWDWFLLSFHSLGVFIATIILVIQIWFLIVKKDKTYPTYWLIGLFTSFAVMLSGYVFAYSVYNPFSAYHRYMTIFTLFGQVCFLVFSYYFPKNDTPKESKVIIPIGFILAIGAYSHFVYNTFKMEKIYNFEAHAYNFDFGAQTAMIILLIFLLSLQVLLRKTIRYSEYDGRFKKWLIKPGEANLSFYIKHYFSRFIVGFIKFLFPRGKEAKAVKTFFIVLVLLIVTAITNVLNKAGILSYEYYAMYYSNSTLIICFVMLMAYINSSGEPTTFMVKLVGISLVAVLLVIGFVSNITLYLSESDYDNQRVAQITAQKHNIVTSNYSELPSEIRYILKKPMNVEPFGRKLELLYVANDENISQELIDDNEKKSNAFLIKEKKTQLQKKNPKLSAEELESKSIEEFKKSRQYKNLFESLSEENKRLYREAGNHYTYFDIKEGQERYEVGFSYKEYRIHTHKNSLKLFIVTIVTTILVLILFPIFFESSLTKPLNQLLRGVHKVNLGNLDVVVPIKVQDEIGFLSSSFNSMVASIKQAKEELQDYANTLEEKVEERTKEVQEKMNEVQALKIQQDGDYFLTSLLTKPLFINANKSEIVKVDFIIRQKKNFEFRNKAAELGGDVCITGNLKLGKQNKFRRYTMAMNGDAMGKSMQGAGGSLVMGVVMNSIMARSASGGKILDTTPEKWLTDAYNECHSVFKSFNGSMVLSATVTLIDDSTGDMFYWNAEHPFSILYRDAKASFIEEDLQLRKLGLESEYEFKVRRFKLLPGDVLLLASDGRDDIDLTPNEPVRTINDDESLILGIVEEAKCDLDLIEKILRKKGNITDDLSMVKVMYNEGLVEIPQEEFAQDPTPVAVNETSNLLDVSEAYLLGRQLYQEGKIQDSLEVLGKGFLRNDSNPKLNKLLGLISFKAKNYHLASHSIGKYIEHDPRDEEMCYYLSLSLKKTGNYFTSLETARRVYELNPNNVNNLVNLSDLYRISGNKLNAKVFSEKALAVDANNKNALRLLAMILESEKNLA
ncbi:MAG: SpoIIE family protein phosphatase [Leptospiraceae bacterium]|nr:SpoIIE family protein phosphatase [Leptospiraceae bacterium]